MINEYAQAILVSLKLKLAVEGDNCYKKIGMVHLDHPLP